MGSIYEESELEIRSARSQLEDHQFRKLLEKNYNQLKYEDLLKKEKARKMERQKSILNEKLKNFEFKKTQEAKLWLKAYERVNPEGKNSRPRKDKTLADIVDTFSSIKLPREKDVVNKGVNDENEVNSLEGSGAADEREVAAAPQPVPAARKVSETIGLNRASNSSVSVPVLAPGTNHAFADVVAKAKDSQAQPGKFQKKLGNMNQEQIEDLERKIREMKAEYAKNRGNNKPKRINTYNDGGSTVVDNRSFYGNDIDRAVNHWDTVHNYHLTKNKSIRTQKIEIIEKRLRDIEKSLKK